MTGPSSVPDVLIQQFDGRAVDDVRYTPHSPNGYGAQLPASTIAELGAILGAQGAERNALTALLQRFQAVTVKAHIEALPEIIQLLSDLHGQTLNRLIQEVQALPVVTAPASGNGNGSMFTRFTGLQSASQPVISYVNLESVLRLLTAAAQRQTGR